MSKSRNSTQSSNNMSKEKRKVRFQTSVSPCEESAALKTFLLFESGNCGHLTLAQFRRAVTEVDHLDQVRCR